MFYLVFAYDTYYPSGGWNDFLGYCATEKEAVSMWKQAECDYGEVVEMPTMKVVREFSPLGRD